MMDTMRGTRDSLENMVVVVCGALLFYIAAKFGF